MRVLFISIKKSAWEQRQTMKQSFWIDLWKYREEIDYDEWVAVGA